MDNLISIRNAFPSGAWDRLECRMKMLEKHLILRQYQELISGTEVASIEIHPEELVVVTHSGLRLHWNLEDSCYAPSELINIGHYESEECPVLNDAARGASTIFDVGSNIGFFSLQWAANLAPGGKIHAFEPVPLSYSQLQRNIVLNRRESCIVANNTAVGETASTLTLFIPEYPGPAAASLNRLHPNSSNVEISVPVISLDEYYVQAGCPQLDMLKADVEGAELFVIKGAYKTIAAQRPLIFLELLRKWAKPFGYHPNDVISLLRGIGYRCFVLNDNALAPFEVMDEETTHKNFFFADPQKHADFLARHGV
ncbi:FkbM family methyltransferase [Telmatospirillum siberiense]|uniref:Methyltransferase FkbM domain-containing protein n=1 Tax=Telmatospirillum siberiense TaxID=382514 RepID=A0A2N3PZZ8_9PROT|nr:FkbM family methyltransferase [Telmatospirillum siberiense]PKU25980.1 hypothetical protein CWS72_02220 [Telmatospirillum siberiense]